MKTRVVIAGLVAVTLAGSIGAVVSEHVTTTGKPIAARTTEHDVPGIAAPGDTEQDVVQRVADAPTTHSAPKVTRARPSSYDGNLRKLRHPTPSLDNARIEFGEPAPVTATATATEADHVFGLDNALQITPATAPAPAPSGAVIDALGYADGGSGFPPDTNIDVGPTVIIETVNSMFAIYDKATRAKVAGPTTFNDLIDGTNKPCDANNHGDPVVLYDSFANRWILSDFAWTNGSNGPFYECFAVSKTSDPVAGGWWFYAFQTDAGSYLADYPKLGVWPDGIYMSANVFDMSTGLFSSPQAWAFDRVSMEAGRQSDAVSFTLPSWYFGLLPSNARVQTGTPPVGRPNMFVSTFYTNYLSTWNFAVDWSTPGNSTFSSNPVTTYTDAYNTGPKTVTSPANSIETLSPRLMMQNQYSNINGIESLWLTHTVGSNAGIAQVRWYELNVTGGSASSTLRQQSTWGPDDGVGRLVPSIAVDRLGDAAVGYTASSSTVNPGLRYAGRRTGDPLDTLTLNEQVLLAGGESPTLQTSHGEMQRWGDYATMTLDPTDGCTFWFASEIFRAGESVLWDTAIGSFIYPGCTDAPALVTPLTLSGTPIVDQPITVDHGSWTGAPDSYTYQWQRYNASNWVDITNADNASYLVVAGDLGHRLRAKVTAKVTTLAAPLNSAVEYSTEGVATMQLLIPVRTPATANAYTFLDTSTILTATPSTWASTVTSRAYEWLRDGSLIGGQNTASYTIVASRDAGHIISVRETVNGVSLSTSDTQIAPHASSGPTITASGVHLSVSSIGAWLGGTTATTAYQWLRGPLPGQAITSAIGSAYTTSSADAGRDVRLRVTLSTNGASESAVSNPISIKRITTPPTPPWVAAIVITPTKRTSIGKGLPIQFTPTQSATIVVTVRSGNTIIGTKSVRVTNKKTKVKVSISKRWAKAAKTGSALTITFTGATASGAKLAPIATGTTLR
ncbi:MAG: hypothetical protein WCG62_04875 [Actinomycetes bacterium]